MKIYEGTLTLKKLTRKMAVYSNLDLVAQYVPQKMFTARGLKKQPATLIFALTVPGIVKRERRRTAAGKGKLRATKSVTGESTVNKRKFEGG